MEPEPRAPGLSMTAPFPVHLDHLRVNGHRIERIHGSLEIGEGVWQARVIKGDSRQPWNPRSGRPAIPVELDRLRHRPAGVADRLDAIGGTLQAQSALGGGTVVAGLFRAGRGGNG
jgi:hypothetical protein